MRVENAARILLIILLIVPSSPYYKCERWRNIHIRQQCNHCGLCLKDADTGGYRCAKCAWGRLDYFYAEELCKAINKCDRNVNQEKCKAFKCLPVFGSFKCECDKNTFGRICEFSRPQGVLNEHYAVVADVILTPLMT